MPEKFTTDALVLIGAQVAEKKLDTLGIKFNTHQRKVMIASMASIFVGGAAAVLRMQADGHDISEIAAHAAEVADQIKNSKQ